MQILKEAFKNRQSNQRINQIIIINFSIWIAYMLTLTNFNILIFSLHKQSIKIMQKVVLSESNGIQFQKQVKIHSSTKLQYIQPQIIQPKAKLLTSMKLKKNQQSKNTINIQNESRKNNQLSKQNFSSPSTNRKFKKIVRSSQHFEGSQSKIIGIIQSKVIKQRAADLYKINQLIALQIDFTQIDTRNKSNQELKNIIDTLQKNHLKQIKILESIIYQLFKNNNIQNNLYFDSKTYKQESSIQQIMRLKNENELLKKKYYQSIDSHAKLIQKFQEMEIKIKKQKQLLETQIKQLNRRINQFTNNLKSIQTHKKISTEKYEKQIQPQKQKINLGHIFTFKKFDCSQKNLKSKILQTEPEFQISCLKSNIQINPEKESYYQYYNQKSKKENIKTQGSKHISSAKKFLKERLSFQCDQDDKKCIIQESKFISSSSEILELQLQSNQSKI